MVRTLLIRSAGIKRPSHNGQTTTAEEKLPLSVSDSCCQSAGRTGAVFSALAGRRRVPLPTARLAFLQPRWRPWRRESALVGGLTVERSSGVLGGCTGFLGFDRVQGATMGLEGGRRSRLSRSNAGGFNLPPCLRRCVGVTLPFQGNFSAILLHRCYTGTQCQQKRTHGRSP